MAAFQDTPGDNVVELDHRSSGSLDVSLFWNRTTNAVVLQVIDWAGDDDFVTAVDPATAMQAFRHPFAYSAGRAETRLVEVAPAPRRSRR